MPATFYTHNEIVDVITEVKPFNNFLLSFFGMEHLSETETINFDKLADDKRIAVFINPRLPGKVSKQKGFQVATLKPGYVKHKVTVEPTHVFRRKAGQPLNTGIVPSERYAATVVDLAISQVTALNRRLEWMAAQLLLKGAYTMLGEDTNTEVDFARDTDKTVTLANPKKWLVANANVSPVEDVEDLLGASQSPIRGLVFGTNAWKAFRRDPLFKEQVTLDSRLGIENLTNMPQKNGWEDVTLRGTLMSGTVPMYTFTGTYLDPASGDETLYIPDDAVLGIPSPDLGYQCFSVIQDADANYQAMPYFLKNWVENDPGVPFLMLQSAPLLAHTRINGTFAITTGAV